MDSEVENQALPKTPSSMRNSLKMDELGQEIIAISFPVLLGLGCDPLASLVDTAFIGQLGDFLVPFLFHIILGAGSVKLAAVGVSISVLNLVSKIFNFPLLNITTSYVAEDYTSRKLVKVQEQALESSAEVVEELNGKRVLPAVSSALIVGLALGLLEAFILLLLSWPILNVMGILEVMFAMTAIASDEKALSQDSPLRVSAQQYLAWRAIGSPAVVVSLATQGVFRGFKDTRTPFYATVAGNVIHIFLDPILMFTFSFGVSGAAIATVVSEYILAFLLLRRLNDLVILVPPSSSDLSLARFVKSGGLLLTRTLAILLTMTLATTVAARQGVAPMAAHQICLQIWLAASLLSDSLALAGQAIIADAFAKSEMMRVKETTIRVLQMGTGLGIFMGIIVGLGEGRLANLFTDDKEVIRLVAVIIPFVAATQPINAVAFVLDGIFYGASEFGYAAYSMVCIGVVSSTTILIASDAYGLTGVWIGLTVLMSLRMLSGLFRLGLGKGPWDFLR